MSVINFQSWNAQDSEHFVEKHPVFYKSVHCMIIFQIFQCKEAIFCSKAVLLEERLQNQRSQNSKKSNP